MGKKVKETTTAADVGAIKVRTPVEPVVYPETQIDSESFSFVVKFIHRDGTVKLEVFGDASDRAAATAQAQAIIAEHLEGLNNDASD